MSNEFSLPPNPPPPLFLGEKEKALVKALNDEITDRILNQVIIYFAIDLQSSFFHPLYGECIDKQFLPPIKINCLVQWERYRNG